MMVNSHVIMVPGTYGPLSYNYGPLVSYGPGHIHGTHGVLEKYREVVIELGVGIGF